MGVVDGAHHNGQLRSQLAHVAQYRHARMQIGVSDDDSLRAREPGGHQYLAATGIAVDDALAGSDRGAHALRIHVQRNEADILGVEQAREILSAAAIAAHNHVMVFAERLHGDVVHLLGAPRPFAAAEQTAEWIHAVNQQGCD